ncbi:hypothetical protein Droror1_Dr00000534 [Drosera rotundifolia]
MTVWSPLAPLQFQFPRPLQFQFLSALHGRGLHASQLTHPHPSTAAAGVTGEMATASEDESAPSRIDEEDESLKLESDVELLKRAWQNEKGAPEILEYQSALVRRSSQQIHLMEDLIEELTKRGDDPLIVSIYQMDLDRAQFLLRSYLRIRLQKIEATMLHVAKTDLWNRLSRQEQNFAQRCIEDMGSHMDESVLSKLPSGYQSNLKQSNASDEDDMVPEPNLNTFVFCKSQNSIGAITLDDSGDEIVDLVAGELYVLRYKTIKPYVERDYVCLWLVKRGSQALNCRHFRLIALVGFIRFDPAPLDLPEHICSILCVLCL